MEFFIDTADVGLIREALDCGLCDGVTTNPSLVAKTGKSFDTVISEILEIVNGPVSLEVTATEYDEMMVQARNLAARADNVVVKLPLTLDGLKATRTCTDEGIHTNVTLCFSLSQAILAAKAGATYISPFVGRLDDISSGGMSLIHDIVEVYQNYDYATKVLVASVRHPEHIADAARIGADVATIPFDVVKKLVHHPLTDLGLARFMEDWKKVPSS